MTIGNFHDDAVLTIAESFEEIKVHLIGKRPVARRVARLGAAPQN
jgi:hypothetical protein